MSERVNVASVMREGADHLVPNKTVAPRAGQPFTELSEQIAAQSAALPPERPNGPAVLPIVQPHEWRFRTEPGRCSTAIRLSLPIETDDLDETVKRKNKYKRWLERQIKRGRIDKSEVANTKDFYGLKADKAVFDILGEYSLVFTPTVGADGKRAKEAQYVTTEPVVAEYIRARLKRGDFAGEIYEDVRPMLATVNGQQVYVVPADDTARQAFAQAGA